MGTECIRIGNYLYTSLAINNSSLTPHQPATGRDLRLFIMLDAYAIRYLTNEPAETNNHALGADKDV